MKVTRIPYSLPMARARRAGIKTQTRRIMRPQPVGESRPLSEWSAGLAAACGDPSPDPTALARHQEMMAGRVFPFTTPGGGLVSWPCPYGGPGDILLPIEPWRAPAEFDGLPPIQIPAGTPIWLDANGPAPEGFGRYRHARFMPKHLIQARDELVAVRVERLQDISEEDAISEGVERVGDKFKGYLPIVHDGRVHELALAKTSYSQL